MPAPSYIPPTDNGFDLFLQNFSTLITANPTNYGLIAGDAVIISAQYTAYHAAFLLATNPATRTPVTVAAKDATRFAAEAVVRPYAQRVANSLTVSDALKVGLGLNLHGTPLTPVPAPSVAPLFSMVSGSTGVHTLLAKNPLNPTSKAMPPGVIGVQVFSAVGTPAPKSIDDATFLDSRSKQPMNVSTAGNISGAIVTYYARYFTRSGPGGASQFGPWSDPITAAVL